MDKIIEINRCADCIHCEYVFEKVPGNRWICLKNNDKQIDDIYSIPDWCPLEEVKNESA